MIADNKKKLSVKKSEIDFKPKKDFFEFVLFISKSFPILCKKNSILLGNTHFVENHFVKNHKEDQNKVVYHFVENPYGVLVLYLLHYL
jgi:hypothetical protein